MASQSLFDSLSNNARKPTKEGKGKMRTNTRKFGLALTWLTLAAMVLAVFGTVPMRAGGPWYVNDGTGSDSNDCISAATACKTIGGAIGKASDGDTINVAAGTYDEQVVIDKSLTLQGVGITTVIKPSQTTANNFQTFSRKVGGPSDYGAPIVVANVAGGSVTIKDLKIDGSLVTTSTPGSRFFGIMYRGTGGLVDSVTVESIGIETGDGMYLVGLDQTVTIEVKECTVSGCLKNSITANYASLTANIHHNTATGMGPTSAIAQNGIQIGFGATGTVSNNTVNNHCWTGTYGGTNDPATDSAADGAAGVLLYHPSATTEVGNNTLTGNQFGIWTVGASAINVHDNNITGLSHTGNAYPVGITVWSADQWSDDFGYSEVGTTGSITGNTLATHDYGILVQDYTAGGAAPSVVAHSNKISGNSLYGAWSNAAFDAEKNWWGDATGPAHATNPHGGSAAGDAVSDNVDFKPWYATSTTTPSTEYVSVDHPGGSIIAWSDTIQGGVDAALAGDTINVAAGTYNENVTVIKAVTLNGANAGTPGNGSRVTESTIDGGTTTAVGISASNVVLDGFTITIGTKAADDKAGGVVIANDSSGLSGVTVKNNIIKDISDTGTDADANCTYGILVWGTTNGPSNINIEHNAIQNVEEYGICINDKSSDVTIDGNSITNMLAADRTTESTKLGVAIGVGGSAPGPTDVTIVDNTINTGLTGDGSATDGGVGVGMAYAPTGVTVKGNDITGNTEGIAVQSTTAPTVHYNNITGNTAYGLHKYDEGALDAERNYWGSGGTGEPGQDGNNGVSGTGVDYDPWIGADGAKFTADYEDIEAGGSTTLDLKGGEAEGSEIYVDMGDGQTGTFLAVEATGSPSQGFGGMGGGSGLAKSIVIETDAADGTFVMCVKLHYTDAELTAAVIAEDDLRLYYWDESASEWKLAVEANTEGTIDWRGNEAPPDPPTTADLGKHGVDKTNNIAWAVVDHATDYSAGEGESEAWVDNDYTALSCGGHIWHQDAFDKIQDAIDSCAAGATIHVYDGTYAEAVTVNKAGDTIVKIDSGTVTVNGNSGVGSAFTVSAVDVTIEDVLIDGHTGSANSTSPGILVNSGGDNLTVQDCEIKRWADGIELAASVTSFKVIGNWIHDNTDAGLQVNSGVSIAGNVTIEGNLFKDNGGYGINNLSGNSLLAEYNSWGDYDGPVDTTGGDGISADVDAVPFTFAELFVDVDPDNLAATLSVNENDTFDVAVKVDAAGLYAVQFKLTYDNELLTLNSTTDGTFKGTGSCSTDMSTSGVVEVYCTRYESDADVDSAAVTITILHFTADLPVKAGTDDGPWTNYFDLSTAAADLGAGAQGGIEVYVNNGGFGDPSGADLRTITDSDDGQIDITGIAQYTGFVDLQGRADDSGATVEVYNNGTMSGATKLAADTNSASGAYTTVYGTGKLLTVGTTYYLFVNADYYLPTTALALVGTTPADTTYQQWKVLNDRPTTALVNVKLLGGDATNDNVVDVSDLSSIGGDYGKNSSNWDHAYNDVNIDGQVDILDLVLAAGNYNLNKSPWWTP